MPSLVIASSHPDVTSGTPPVPARCSRYAGAGTSCSTSCAGMMAIRACAVPGRRPGWSTPQRARWPMCIGLFCGLAIRTSGSEARRSRRLPRWLRLTSRHNAAGATFASRVDVPPGAQGQCTPESTVVRRSGVVRAAAQAAVVVAQDERLRLLAGSALGRRTDQSKQSAAGVDDPRRHDQSPQVSGHGRGPDGGLQSTGQTAYERCEGLLEAV